MLDLPRLGGGSLRHSRRTKSCEQPLPIRTFSSRFVTRATQLFLNDDEHTGGLVGRPSEEPRRAGEPLEGQTDHESSCSSGRQAVVGRASRPDSNLGHRLTRAHGTRSRPCARCA
jgi:hypothetical protein